MSKSNLLIVVLCASLCAIDTYAQIGEKRTLSIQDMFSLADANSRSISSYAIGIEQASQAVKVAKNNNLPSVDAQLSVSYLGDINLTDRDFSNGMSVSMPHLGNNLTIEASQVIYAGKAISNGIKVAELQSKIASLDYERNKQDIHFMLVGYYLELYKINNQISIYEKNIEQTEQLVANIKAKESEGAALQNDITRYELQLQNLELVKTRLINSATIINSQLITTLGLPENTIIINDTTVINNTNQSADESTWQELAGNSSPILKLKQSSVEISNTQEKIVSSDRMPQIALIAAEHLDGPITIEVPTIDKNLNYWFVGVGIKYNFGALYKSNKNRKLAELTTQRAKEEHALAKENIEVAVKAAYIKYLETFVDMQTQEKSLELAQQNYDVINYRYINDLALITDMLDASNSKLSAELQLINSQINNVYNFYNLQYTAGTL